MIETRRNPLVDSRAARVLQHITGPWTLRNALSWALFIALLFVIKWMVVDIVRIPTDSMSPTLNGDWNRFRSDYVAVNRLAYGLRVPFTEDYLFRWSEPKRWEIVLFRTPPGRTGARHLIKRVAALPSERPLIIDNRLFIDEVEVVPPEHLQDVLHYGRLVLMSWQEAEIFLLRFAEIGKLPSFFFEKRAEAQVLHEEFERLVRKLDGRKVNTLSVGEKSALLAIVNPKAIEIVQQTMSTVRSRRTVNFGFVSNPEYRTVPADHFYVLGDNSEHSVDSRSRGWVPRKYVLGRAFAVALPVGRIRDLTGFSTTWWGRVLLFGIPAAILLWYLVPGYVARSWRLKSALNELRLQPGNHLLINRIIYGPRLPFTNRRLVWWRLPRGDEVIAYAAPGDQLQTQSIRIGQIADATEAGDAAVPICEIDHPDSEQCVPKEHIVGRVELVWWPLSAMRRIERFSSENNDAKSNTLRA